MLGRPNTTDTTALFLTIGLRRLFICFMLLKASHGGDSLSMKVLLSITSHWAPRTKPGSSPGCSDPQLLVATIVSYVPPYLSWLAVRSSTSAWDIRDLF